MNSFQYKGITISLIHGDITAQKTDAIVNAANEYLSHGAGVAGAISSKGGSAIQKESDQYVKKYGIVPIGSCGLTSAGKLPSKYVIHAVGPVFDSRHPKESQKLLFSAFKNTFKLAEKEKMNSISVPPISSGIFGYPKEECAKVLFLSIKEFADERDKENAHAKMKKEDEQGYDSGADFEQEKQEGDDSENEERKEVLQEKIETEERKEVLQEKISIKEEDSKQNESLLKENESIEEKKNSSNAGDIINEVAFSNDQKIESYKAEELNELENNIEKKENEITQKVQSPKNDDAVQKIEQNYISTQENLKEEVLEGVKDLTDTEIIDKESSSAKEKANIAENNLQTEISISKKVEECQEIESNSLEKLEKAIDSKEKEHNLKKELNFEEITDSTKKEELKENENNEEHQSVENDKLYKKGFDSQTEEQKEITCEVDNLQNKSIEFSEIKNVKTISEKNSEEKSSNDLIKNQKLEANENFIESNNLNLEEEKSTKQQTIEKIEETVVTLADADVKKQNVSETQNYPLEKKLLNEQNLEEKKGLKYEETQKIEASKINLKKKKKEPEFEADSLKEIIITIIDRETLNVFQNEFKAIKEAGMENITRDILIQEKIKIEKHKDSNIYQDNDCVVCYYSSSKNTHSVCQEYKDHDKKIYRTLLEKTDEDLKCFGPFPPAFTWVTMIPEDYTILHVLTDGLNHNYENQDLLKIGQSIVNRVKYFGNIYSIALRMPSFVINEERGIEVLAEFFKKCRSVDYIKENNQLFSFDHTSDGYFVIKVAHTGLVLDVDEALNTNGSFLIQFPEDRRASQQFKFEAVELE